LIGISGVGVKAGDADAGDVGVLRAPREGIRGTPHALAATGIVVARLEGGDRLLIVKRFEEADCFVHGPQPLNFNENGCPLPAFVSLSPEREKPEPEVGFWKFGSLIGACRRLGRMTANPEINRINFRVTHDLEATRASRNCPDLI
jgi:hypothetical protein